MSEPPDRNGSHKSPRNARELLDRYTSGERCFAYADLGQADLTEADLPGVDLSGADLSGAKLSNADLSKANLTGADLSLADVSGADLSGANLSETNLIRTNLIAVNLRGAVLNRARFGSTVVSSNLSEVVGLDSARHLGRSELTTSTILAFKEDLPERFLRGCGLRDEEIAYFRSLIGKPIRYYTCFISHSTADEKFAGKLYNDFQASGIRCWKWDKDARTGESIWGEIDQAIRDFDKLVVVASESSLKSPYVMDEIERAIMKERDRLRQSAQGKFHGNTNVLFPVRLDDYIFDGWEHERKADVVSKVIADARGWDEDPDIYARVRDKLIRDLKTE